MPDDLSNDANIYGNLTAEQEAAKAPFLETPAAKRPYVAPGNPQPPADYDPNVEQDRDARLSPRESRADLVAKDVANKHPLPPLWEHPDAPPVPTASLARKAELAAAGPRGHLSIETRLRQIEEKIFGDESHPEAVPDEEVEANLHEGIRPDGWDDEPTPLISSDPASGLEAPYSSTNPRRI